MKKILSFYLILLLVFLPGCNTSEQKVSSSTDTNSVSENGGISLTEDGYIELIVPENLLGGRNAEDFERSYLNDTNPELSNVITNVVANSDGTISMIFTSEQLNTFKKNQLSYGEFHKRYSNISITNVIYDDEKLSAITVIVKKSEYSNSLMDRSMANILLAINAGMYQLACGTPPGEWHTTITVKDDETGEIISVNEFPNDDMYKAY